MDAQTSQATLVNTTNGAAPSLDNQQKSVAPV
jgi:hypothetical protein